MSELAPGDHHILVVEDDRDLRDGLSDALELEGYAVVGVEHGEAALRHLRQGARPFLILVDLMMPVMDGRAFRDELRKDPELAEIPIVIMTAASRRDLADLAEPILSKPLDIDALFALVQHVERASWRIS
jgi:CheY-like chemotaxis protein